MSVRAPWLLRSLAVSIPPVAGAAAGGGPGFGLDLGGGELPPRGLLFSPPSCFILRGAGGA